jgi:hypothetical protein
VRRRGAVSCVNTLRLCTLVSLLLKVRTAALYPAQPDCLSFVLRLQGRNFIIRLQGRSYGADAWARSRFCSQAVFSGY